jgi:hypothetical protein
LPKLTLSMVPVPPLQSLNYAGELAALQSYPARGRVSLPGLGIYAGVTSNRTGVERLTHGI